MGTAKKRLLAGMVALLGACVLIYWRPYEIMTYVTGYIYISYGIASIAFFCFVKKRSSTVVYAVLRAIMMASFVIAALILAAGVLGTAAEAIKIIKAMDTTETSIERALVHIYNTGSYFLVLLPAILDSILFDSNKLDQKNKSETTTQQPAEEVQ